MECTSVVYILKYIHIVNILAMVLLLGEGTIIKATP